MKCRGKTKGAGSSIQVRSLFEKSAMPTKKIGNTHNREITLLGLDSNIRALSSSSFVFICLHATEEGVFGFDSKSEISVTSPSSLSLRSSRSEPYISLVGLLGCLADF